MGFLKDRKIIYLLFIGLMIRLILATQPGFKIDMDAWFAWAIRLTDLGFPKFYSQEVWTNYTPGYFYVLYLLGLIKTLLNLSSDHFQYLLKIPSIISEIAIAKILFDQIYPTAKKWAYIGSALVLLNPVFIFNSAIWGQIDGFLTLFLLLAVINLEKGKLIYSSFLLGISFLIKPQTIFIAPAILLHLITTFKLKNLLKITIPGLIIILVLSAPFFKFPIVPGLVALVKNMIGDYPYNSMFAYNFWGIFGFWINDSLKWMGITIHDWGYLLLLIYWLIIIYQSLKKRISVLTLSTLSLLSFYYLPTRVHDRYLYPALVFLILVAIRRKSKVLVILAGVLSLIHLINLYQVYIYYDVFYLKMFVPLYNNNLYVITSELAKVWSLMSLLIFVTVSSLLLKAKYEPRKN